MDCVLDFNAVSKNILYLHTMYPPHLTDLLLLFVLLIFSYTMETGKIIREMFQVVKQLHSRVVVQDSIG